MGVVLPGLILTGILGPGEAGQATQMRPAEERPRARPAARAEPRTPRDPAELACTLAGGPGEIHGRARHPGGTDFFAAERGLFVVSDDVDCLDPIELRDGTPEGPLVGIAIVDPERVWLATRDAIFCAESRQFFGRVSRVEDGLPAPPYTGLRATRNGALRIETAEGTFRYRPGALDRPRVRVLSVVGEPFEEGRAYDVDESGSFALRCEAEATGGPSLRYRLKNHHLWRALELDAPRVEGLEPGEHTVIVTAWDRELQRSESVSIPVRVAYPRAFDKRRLIPLALGVGLAVVVGFLGRAHLRGGGRLRFTKAIVSSFLLLAIGLQLLVALIPHGRSWPFVGFTMYLERYDEGSVTYQTALVLVLKSGKQVRVEPYRAGYGLYELRRTLSEVMHGDDDAREAYLAYLRERYPRRHITGFLIRDERRRLTPAGPVRVAPTVLCVYPVDAVERKVARADR